MITPPLTISPAAAYYQNTMNKEFPPILPCDVCGKAPKEIDSYRAEGRKQDYYRVVCICGNGPAQWSMSKRAAIRLWNTYGASC